MRRECVGNAWRTVLRVAALRCPSLKPAMNEERNPVLRPRNQSQYTAAAPASAAASWSRAWRRRVCAVRYDGVNTMGRCAKEGREGEGGIVQGGGQAQCKAKVAWVWCARMAHGLGEI